MITIENGFSKNEGKVIEAVLNYFEVFFNETGYTGKVIDCDGFIQFEVFFGDEADGNLFLLSVGVRDQEDTSNGYCNFIYVPSIQIPASYCNQFIGTTVLLILAKTAHEMKLHFFVTCIVNDRFFDHLLLLGGVADERGDIELDYHCMMRRLSDMIDGM